jgi:hypothetical protein
LSWKLLPVPVPVVPHHDKTPKVLQAQPALEFVMMLCATSLFEAVRSPKMTPLPLPSIVLCSTTAPCEPRS